MTLTSPKSVGYSPYRRTRFNGMQYPSCVTLSLLSRHGYTDILIMCLKIKIFFYVHQIKICKKLTWGFLQKNWLAEVARSPPHTVPAPLRETLYIVKSFLLLPLIITERWCSGLATYPANYAKPTWNQPVVTGWLDGQAGRNVPWWRQQSPTISLPVRHSQPDTSAIVWPSSRQRHMA